MQAVMIGVPEARDRHDISQDQPAHKARQARATVATGCSGPRNRRWRLPQTGPAEPESLAWLFCSSTIRMMVRQRQPRCLVKRTAVMRKFYSVRLSKKYSA